MEVNPIEAHIQIHGKDKFLVFELQSNPILVFVDSSPPPDSLFI